MEFRTFDAPAGERLDVAIALALELSRTYAKELVNEGYVTVDGRPVGKPSTKLAGSEVVSVVLPPPRPMHVEPEDLELDVIYQDDDLAEEVDYLTRAFHYNVPDALRPQVAAGQLVWVPFGRRYLQGIIVRLDDCSPVEETRDLDAIVDPQPVLSPLQIELAHWISASYLAPIHQVILSMLPPGVTQKVELVLRPVEESPKRAVAGAVHLIEEIHHPAPVRKTVENELAPLARP